jgi:hypothetical protein
MKKAGTRFEQVSLEVVKKLMENNANQEQKGRASEPPTQKATACLVSHARESGRLRFPPKGPMKSCWSSERRS